MPPYTGGMPHPNRPITASLIVPLTTADDTALPEGMNVQLLPDGAFAARDGRPASMTKGRLKAWRLDADIAAAVVVDVQARETPLVIDYEHQSLHARENGQPAPAAGWIASVAYVPGRGLFAAVEWSGRARAYIDADEYKYISPVFTFDAKSGAVLRVVNAALTNVPALDGMVAVAAVDATQQETAMDELLERLRWLLNLPITATAEDIIAQLDKLKGMLTGEAAATDASPVDLLALLADLRSQVGAPDPAQYVPMAALTSVQQTVADLTARVAELQAGQVDAAIGADIAAALADGRLTAATEGWARGLGKNDPDALRAYLSAAQPIAALGGMQTRRTPQPSDGGPAALSDDDMYAINQLGLTPEEYRASKEAK